MSDTVAFFDSLSQREGEYCEEIIKQLNAQEWAKPLLSTITDAGGICRENKSFLFELRFAYALYEQGIEPRYEIPGEGGSTIDFGFDSEGADWAVELMRLEETDAAKAATHVSKDSNGIEEASRVLSSTNDDERQSEEGETLKAVQRICQKCERGGQPYKFPSVGGSFHVLLVDFRTFLNGGDEADRINVGLGGKFLKNDFHRRYWDGQLITGVFAEATSVRGAQTIRDRVHFIGFVNETEYKPGCFSAHCQFVANPHLFGSEEEATAAIACWPLKSAKLLNVNSQSES